MPDQKPVLDYESQKPPRKRRKWVIGVGLLSLLAVMLLFRMMTRTAPAPMPATALPANAIHLSVDDVRQALSETREAKPDETRQYHIVIELGSTTKPTIR